MSSSTSNFQYNAPTDFRIAQLPPGIDPELAAAFTQVYSAIQQIIFTLIDNCGIGPRNSGEWVQLASSAVTLLGGNLNRLYVQAVEDIPYGAAVHLVAVSGKVQARLANATNSSKPARAFCTLTTGILAGEVGEVQIGTGTVLIGGLTPGASYFLSTTSGLIAPTPAVAAGNIEQYVGFAIDTTTLTFNTGYWVQH